MAGPTPLLVRCGAEWRSAGTESGALSLTMAGARETELWSATNLATMEDVSGRTPTF